MFHKECYGTEESARSPSPERGAISTGGPQRGDHALRTGPRASIYVAVSFAFGARGSTRPNRCGTSAQRRGRVADEAEAGGDADRQGDAAGSSNIVARRNEVLRSVHFAPSGPCGRG